VVRDVNALLGMGLLERSKTGIRAKKEKILAFLPVVADSSKAEP
jgi:hypothetical protein